jgi:prevent-host-death family protein
MWFLRRLAQLFRPDQVRSVRPGRPVRLAAYNTYDARAFLSHLLVRVAAGEEVVIARRGMPIAKLVPYTGERLRPGLVRTHIHVVAAEDEKS